MVVPLPRRIVHSSLMETLLNVDSIGKPDFVFHISYILYFVFFILEEFLYLEV